MIIWLSKKINGLFKNNNNNGLKNSDLKHLHIVHHNGFQLFLIRQDYNHRANTSFFVHS